MIVKSKKYIERRQELFSNIAVAILISIASSTVVLSYLKIEDWFWKGIFLFFGTLITLLVVFFVLIFLLKEYYGIKSK